MIELPADHAPPVLLQKGLLIHKISQGPTVDEVGAHMLRTALKSLYPHLELDPDHTLLGTPQWQATDDGVSALPTRFESLTGTLIRLFFSDSTANLLEGEHFLTLNPHVTPIVHLDVDIEAIGRLLNDYTPLLFVAFGEQQLAYWNSPGKREPRWRELSDALRKALDVQKADGWDEVQCQVARTVSMHPDRQERAARAPAFSAIRVCLIDIDIVDELGASQHLLLGGAAVLTGRYQERDLVMLYTVEEGYESFTSLEKLGEALPTRIEERLAGRNVQWQLFEPDGDFFDHMAWALVSTQLDAIAAITREDVAGEPADLQLEPALIEHSGVGKPGTSMALDESIPQWLLRASATDLDAYGRSVSALGKLYRNTDTRLFRILPLDTFARTRMREAIIADKPQASSLPLDSLEITITNSFESGGFTLPNPLDTHTENLGEYALQNCPPYQARVQFNPSHAVPDWLSVDYLTTIANKVDIGSAYPRLLKDKLVDDASQASLQKHFYINQLHALLPLMALEYKIRGLAGFDERGYQYILRWLHPLPDHPQPVVIRPLTFVHAGNTTGDTVTDMFVIAPRQPAGGPCLLYRPLFDPPLLQFVSEQNLLYALHQPGDLRDSVLAWLPDSAISFKYAQYAFPVGLPSPWLGLQMLSEPWTSVSWAGPIELATAELSGDVFSTLFNTHAQAMGALAERQSLSNSQRRWALLRDSGWALFSLAANFLSGPAGAAVWVWQSIGDIDASINAYQQGDTRTQWSAAGDLLLSLGILLAHHAGIRRKTGAGYASRLVDSTLAKPAIAAPGEPAAPKVMFNPATLTGELPSSHYSALEANGSVPHRSPGDFSTYLQSLAVAAPDLTAPGVQTLSSGAAPLYRLNGRMYANVGERWFNVRENDDQQVQIVFPRAPAKTGPLLSHNQKGQWFVDTRLRLRGGAGGTSLKSQLREQRRLKAEQQAAFKTALQAFQSREASGNATLLRLHDEMTRATGAEKSLATERYVDQAQTLIGDYEQALQNLYQWRFAGGSEGYLYDLISMTTQLHKNLSLWFLFKRNAYAKLTRELAENTEHLGENLQVSLQAHIHSVRQALTLGQAMVARLQLCHTSILPLELAGGSGITVAQKLRRLLPAFSQWDLKSNEIGMSHEVSMRGAPSSDSAPARDAVGMLIIEAATATRRHSAMLRTADDGAQPAAQITTLSRLIDVYSDAIQRLADLPDEYPDKVDPGELGRISGLIGEFKQLAQEQLDQLLPATLPPAAPTLPKPAVAGPSRPSAKVTKSRPRVPAPKPSTSQQAAALDTVLLARPRPAAQPVLDDSDILAQALDLNENIQGFIEHTRKDALKPNRIPADMQDLFDQQAQRLEAAAVSLEGVFARARQANRPPPPVGMLPLELQLGATRLREEGVRTRAGLLKERQPRLAYVQWMLDNRQIRIEKNPQGRIKTKKRQDYFLEYRVLDVTRQDQPLWLAHFHYDSLNTPQEQFTAAHLKIADEHLQQFTSERREALLALTPLDYVLRRISDPSLFFGAA
ncbi:hypothetical protein ACXR0M_01035 [Pseudomonas sp. Eth.TT006]